MPGDERVPAEVLDLVRLLCQADWTQLSLAAEITEFTDYQASERMEEARRPSWAPGSSGCPGPVVAGPRAATPGPGRPDPANPAWGTARWATAGAADAGSAAESGW